MDLLNPQFPRVADAAIVPFMPPAGTNRPAPYRPAHRLREVIRARGFTQDKLARESHRDPSTLSRIIKGEYELTFTDAEKFARVLGVDVAELLPGAEGRRVPVVGKVGGTGAVFPNEGDAATGELEDVPCPQRLDPRKTEAVRIEGDLMFPLEGGSLLFYSRDPDIDPRDLLRRLCIVKLADDGPVVIKQLRKGSERGRFTLLSANAPPIEDVEIEWAARILEVVPPDIEPTKPIIGRRAA